ncbi:hypothetical protein G6F56_003169 [Rhizopus delemar]|nr:hypothetical protein G6F56_003169 [Rhizopus delemar]
MSLKDKRRLTGYRGDTTEPESVYDDYQHDDVYEEYDGDSDDQPLEEEEDESGEEEDDAGSELSIPDADINFDLVYALHTFAATVEGQASVVRGDALTLLDDSNSYWWLVKVLKTAEVGYIPAENIEITRKDNFDIFPVPPTNKPKERKKVTLAKGVQYQSQFIYGSSDDEEDFESEFQHWNENMYSSDSNSQTSSEEEQEEDDDQENDPYHYYDEPQIVYTENTPAIQQSEEEIAPTLESHISADSDIINDPKDFVYYPEEEEEDEEEEVMEPVEDDTIKISLTPSIARDVQDSNERNSDTSLQTKLKKAAKLEKLLSNPSKEKKTSGIRKFFSRNKKKDSGDERRLSNSTTDTASINSSQSSLVRISSVDSTVKHLKVQAGNPQMQFKEAWADVHPQTTAAELVHQVLSKEERDPSSIGSSYHDYYLIVKTLSGDECTLIPSDKPLEIFYSLTAHLNTPMPSLKKARRISQLMGSDNHVGGPTKEGSQEEVEFFLFSKTKRTEDGEFQIKVSLLPADQLDERNKRVDKIVKIPCSILIKDAVGLLLEKFHILNGVVADSQENEEVKKSLRLVDQTDDDIAKYRLAISVNGQERLLPLDEKLLAVFGDNVPPIHYRRNSNPDRSSITANSAPPEKNETFFLLKCIEKPKREEKKATHTRPHHLLVRQDTPMPRKESTPTDGFAPVPSLTEHIHNESPTLAMSPTTLSQSAMDARASSQSPTQDAILNQLDEAIQDTLSHSSEQTITPRRIRPTSNESMLLCTDDFGMNDLMVIIRGAAIHQPNQLTVRTEISDLFKDSQSRLEQLEKELDRIMLEAIKVYN